MENKMKRFDLEVSKFGSKQAMFNHYLEYKNGKLYRKNCRVKTKNGMEVGYLDKKRVRVRVQLFERSCYFARTIYEMHYGDLKEKLEVGHLNKIPTDNSLENLYLQNRSLSQLRQKLSTDNTSGFKGVSWKKDKQRWKASIKKNYKEIFIGYFNVLENAVAAYEAVSKVLITKTEIEVKEIIKKYKEKELAA